MQLLILNGPNLNMLGQREPEIYGTQTLADIEKQIAESFQAVDFLFLQSNHEGVLIDSLQNSNAEGIVFNPAAFTHYSYAIHDAIKAIKQPVVEVHLSSIHSREEFRKNSVTAAACIGQISGFGSFSYILGIDAVIAQLNADV